MASSRPQSSPEAELKHWLQDVLVDATVEETGKEVKRTTYYTLSEVILGGGLLAVAVTANETSLQHADHEHDQDEYAIITARVAEECHRYARLRHPSVLQFLGAYFPSRAGSLPLLITEHLELTLSQCLNQFANLPDSLKTSILLDVALGMQLLHNQSPAVAHRSLTASNIFLTSNLHAKITYPRIYEAFEHTSENGEMETNELYVSSYAKSGDCKDDIFMFGELMIHVISQRRPKRSPNHSPSLVHQIEHIDVGHVLRGLIMQCLQKDPLLRPTVDEIVSEISISAKTHRTPFHSPTKVVAALADKPAIRSSPQNGSPLHSKVKRLEAENTRLVSQLKVTQAELRHLRVQQRLFGKGSMTEDSDEGEGENEDDDVEMKDAAVQVDILQVNRQKVYVELRKDSSDQSLGFSIAGGMGTSSNLQEGDTSIFITRLASGGLAERDGRLKPGDRLLSVNGKSLSSVTRAEALAALMSITDVCTMVISREELQEELDTTLLRRRSTTRRSQRSQSRKLDPLRLGVTIACEECSDLPEPLVDPQIVQYRNKIIVGGHYSKNCERIYEYDPELDEWSVLANAPVWFFGLTVFQDRITVVGGFNAAQQKCSDLLYCWNEIDKSWMSSLPPMPTARMYASATSLGSSLVVAGGRNAQLTFKCIEVFNFDSQQWYTAHPLLVERSSMKSVCYMGSWYLMGGEQQGFATTRALHTPLQSLIDSSLHKSGSVSSVKAIPPTPKTYSAVSILGNKIVAIGGGESDEATPSVTVYALSEDPVMWVEVGELPFPLVHSTAVATSDHEVLLIGGRGENNANLNKVYRLYLKEGTSRKDSGIGTSTSIGTGTSN